MTASKLNNTSYALITSAKNEEGFIHLTFESILSQTILPARWVIVSDGSTDKTDDIIKGYRDKYFFIEFIRINGSKTNQGFASKVYALKEAYDRIKEYRYEFIVVVDADVSFESTYYQRIISK